ncbi:MAG: heavy-metal-associated domain-containing protein [Verrucomicrobia bacterium]|nr:heavy-metal-associated domain-containing protein [Verrucomicrobiota bacterium]
MKHLFALILAASTALALPGFAGDSEKCEKGSACCATKAAANVTKAQFKLDGVTCATSAAKAEAALLKVKGVKSAHVCPDSHVAAVEFDKSVTSSRRISSAAKKAGFKVEKGS